MKSQNVILKLSNIYLWVIGGIAVFGILYAGYKLSFELFNIIKDII